MSVIVLGGMIGLGKTSVSELLGRALNLPVYYEKVDGNRVLKRFYTVSKEESEAERLTFLLQLEFLVSRFNAIKSIIKGGRGVLDSSIFEDVYFAKRNLEYGKRLGENRISDLEFSIYKSIFDEMLEETSVYSKVYGKKTPDLMVYLKGSFETVMRRIRLRGRDFEQDDSLIDYYRFLWEGYDNWGYNEYKASKVITIDMDNIDIVNRKEDADYVVNLVKEELAIPV